MPDYDALHALVDRLSAHRVLVVGDVVLDEYLVGSASRLSREAPIPVLEFERRDLIPGGAANPSANVVALGSQAIQVGVIGADSNAETMRNLLSGRGIEPAGLIVDSTRQTTTKTRIMAQMGLRFPQQVARIDRISRHPVDGPTAEVVVAAIYALGATCGAIMASDYLSGMMTAPVVKAISDVCTDRRILATADAQGALDKYAGYDLVKCNADEAARYVGRDLITDADFATAGEEIASRIGLRIGMLITRGPDGITVAQPGQGSEHLPALHVEDVYDTVGAGDTVLAVVTLALLGGATPIEGAQLANLAAGIVVRKVGNYAPSPAELHAAIEADGK